MVLNRSKIWINGTDKALDKTNNGIYIHKTRIYIHKKYRILENRFNLPENYFMSIVTSITITEII